MTPVTASDPQWTIDEFAQRTGMTVRNIRAHQSRGLLAPPAVRGRTGYYGSRHAERIELIQKLQAEGFNLEAIRRLIEAAPGAGDEPLRFLRAMHEPYTDESPEEVTVEQLIEEWGPDGELLSDRTVELGFLRQRADGGYEYPNPGMIRAARQLAGLGVPLARQLEVAAVMRHHTAATVTAYVDLFVDQIWEPFCARGLPEEEWPAISKALEELRPLSRDALLATFAEEMDDASARAFGQAVERLGVIADD